MASNADTRLCHFEGRRFPLREFEESAEHGMVHKAVPRHTIRGKVLEDPSEGELMPAADRMEPPPTEE